MGIDLKAGGRRVGHNVRTAPKSNNAYLKLLVKLYSFLHRRAESKFAGCIKKRLCMSRTNRAPLSISRLSRYMKDNSDKTAVIVGTVTDDSRLLDVPKLSICALKFTSSARYFDENYINSISLFLTHKWRLCLCCTELVLLKPVASALPWISLPFVPPREPTPSFFVVPRTQEKLLATLATVPQLTTLTPMMLLSLMSAPRAGSLRKLEAVDLLMGSRFKVFENYNVYDAVPVCITIIVVLFGDVVVNIPPACVS